MGLIMFEALKRWLGFDKKPQCHTARMAHLSKEAGDRFRANSKRRRRARPVVTEDNGIDYAPVDLSPLNMQVPLSFNSTTPISNSLLSEQNNAPTPDVSHNPSGYCDHYSHHDTSYSHSCDTSYASCDAGSSSTYSSCD